MRPVLLLLAASLSVPLACSTQSPTPATVAGDDDDARQDQTCRYEALCAHYGMEPTRTSPRDNRRQRLSVAPRQSKPTSPLARQARRDNHGVAATPGFSS